MYVQPWRLMAFRHELGIQLSRDSLFQPSNTQHVRKKEKEKEKKKIPTRQNKIAQKQMSDPDHNLGNVQNMLSNRLHLPRLPQNLLQNRLFSVIICHQ